ncbi:metacaspase-2-like isoform X2 [Leptopilina boulardi]|uniref:metacaspase-2-like isoform X2 n=1 Tax=Leptopilina boulardi TaxID=63433 RepID=UPI0021F660FB|nr:metacaspase-2-like isoform X2 [Leptopilina boulardi]
MEKWKSKGKTIQKTDSLLPPTLRQQQQQQQDVDSSTIEKRKGKRWTIGGFLKRLSHRDGGDASSSGDASSNHNTPVIRRKKSKNILKNKSSRRAICSSLQTKKDFDFQYKSGKSLEINPFIFPIVESLTVPQEFLYSRSSDGSLDGSTKKVRKDKIKARVEAKRDKLCTNSSTDDSSNESKQQNNGYKSDVCLRRRRNARAERLMKSLCREENVKKNEQSTSIIDYQLKIQENKNPLVKQTFQYFSDFDRKNNYEREKNSRRRQTQQIFPVISNSCDVNNKKSKSQENLYFQLNFPNEIQQSHASSLDSHYKSSKIQNPPNNYRESPINYRENSINSREKPINYRESPINYKESSYLNYRGNSRENPMNKENSLNFQEYSNNDYRENNQYDNMGIYSRIRSPSQKSDSSYRSDLRTRSSASESFRKILPENNYYSPREFNSVNCQSNLENFTNISQKQNKYQINENREKLSSPRENNSDSKRSSKNLEEALCELEAIYNSLQLGDEDLLERAEKRDMEEYSNKKMENHYLEKKTSKFEPNIVKDDMAFRRLKSSNRPTSDGHVMLSNISYLITSPIASRRNIHYMESKQKQRNKEPDIKFDDVVFRNLHHANNSLKVIEPQPPFGIPLGPITGSTESDYLHTKPTKIIANSRCEPDIVMDDLAFRNLRKDKKDVDKKPSNFVTRKKRAVRSLSANLYSLINKSDNEEIEWNFDNVNLDINGNQSEEVQQIKSRGISPLWNEENLNSPTEKTENKINDLKKIEIQKVKLNDDSVIDEKHEKNFKTPKQIEKNSILEKIDNQNKNQGTVKKSYPEIKFSEKNCEKSEIDNQSCDKIQNTLKQMETIIVEKMENPLEIQVKNSQNQTIEEKSRKDLGPFTEHEISIYRQLCQELENLVDSTKLNDVQLENSNEIPIVSKRETKNLVDNLTSDEIDEIGNEITCLREKLTNFVNTKEINNDNQIIKNSSISERSEESKNKQVNNDDDDNKIGESNLLKDEMPECSRNVFNLSRNATSSSEGADTTLT